MKKNAANVRTKTSPPHFACALVLLLPASRLFAFFVAVVLLPLEHIRCAFVEVHPLFLSAVLAVSCSTGDRLLCKEVQKKSTLGVSEKHFCSVARLEFVGFFGFAETGRVAERLRFRIGR